MSKEPIGFLLGLAERPTALVPGDKLTFGREASNTNPMSDPLLSRRHASIEVQFGGLVMVTDLGSTNGSFLNDKRLPPNVAMPMKSGDKVRLGARLLTLIAGKADRNVSSAFVGKTPPAKRVRIVERRSESKRNAGPFDPTRKHEPVGIRGSAKGTMVGKLPPEAQAKLNEPCPLKGRLEDYRLPQLLQFIHSSGKTGELTIDLDGKEAIISFEAGRIVFAMLEAALGIDVIGSVAERGEGDYAFKEMPLVQRPKNVTFSTQSIILQCCHFYADFGPTT